MASPAFELWLEFEISDDWIVDPEDDFFNMQINLPDGRSYGLNVWTFKYFNRACAENRDQGDYLAGRYLPAPDLFVERLDRKHIEAVVANLIESEALADAWLIPPEDEEPR